MAKAFLIIQTAFIGDVILSTAVMEKLHRNFPDATIDVLVRKGNEGVLLQHPFVRKMFVWDKSKKIRDMLRIRGEMRAVNYDAIINLQRFASSGFFTLLAKGREKIGFDKNPLSRFFTKALPHHISATPGGPHEVDRCLSLVAHFTDNGRDLPRIYPAQAHKDKIDKLIAKYRPFVTASPASVWFTKQWPEERWIEWMRSLPNHLDVILLGGPSDAALCHRIREQTTRPGVHILAGQLNLLESAEVMRRAVMNYTNDSAPMHLCSAVNAPVTTIFCSTVPEFGFGPLSEQSHSLQFEGELSCRPCGLHGHAACPKGHFQCAAISVDLLYQTLPESP